MKAKVIILAILVLLIPAVKAQTNPVPGTKCLNCPPNSKFNPSTVANGNQSLTTTYTNTACGLNYLSVSHPLCQRVPFNQYGIAQPASYNITGIPACAVVL